ncbi:efflux RND transporter periplasmic adaptor subunit [Tardiphaga sp. P9-11]|uniref:efflux RND transporter periplasmic adaptor subunit n=1 Tax=Tardiphaga sp. P9-11 TaxID=2024614 RepID=UPI0011F401EA|nr:efflux RND transporter periplasmic adaptor subunit [Tardiphaga sp. P9-11]KAA0070407.1 hypothetical protein CIW50_27585 [Tardiphaga sp. P9-11]
MIQLPKSLELAGVVVDAEGGPFRLAPAPGTVVRVLASSGSRVARGDAVLAITGLDYIAAQQALIDAFRGNYPRKPKSLDDVALILGELRSQLRDLKFSREQIQRIQDAGTVLDPIPVLTNQGGVVGHSMIDGQAFHANDALFCMTKDTRVHASIEQRHIAFIRTNKAVTVTFADGTKAIGTIEGFTGTADDLRRDASIKVSDQQKAIGEPVSISITFEHWERFHPKATSSMWRYDYEPRGAERTRLRTLLGEPNVALPVKRTVKNVAPSMADANPFAPGRLLSKRPERTPPNPFNTPLMAVPKAAILRPSLPIGTTDFVKWTISTEPAKVQALAPEWRRLAQVATTGRNGDVCAMLAQFDGVFCPATWRPGDVIRAGAQLGHIEIGIQADADSGSPSTSEQQANNVSRIESVYADHDGVAMNESGEQRHVRVGEMLVELRTVNMYTFRTGLPDAEFAQLPRVVTAALYAPSAQVPEYVNRSALITAQSRSHGNTMFDISFSSEAGAFQINWGKYVVLTAETDRRKVLSVPTDSIVQISRSSEVLVHSAIGKLTPVPISCGARYGDQVEVLSGLEEGHRVVRDLKLLFQEWPNIRAIMSGFWRPQS